MVELLALDLVKKRLVTNQIVLDIGYDKDNLNVPNLYKGEITVDKYGRNIPKNAHGTVNIDHRTSSSKIIINSVVNLYNEIVNNKLLIRRINITANNVVNENTCEEKNEQINIFVNYEELNKKRKQEQKERELQKAIIDIKDKYGKNAIIKGMNLQEEGTTIERNKQVGGHSE